jgi:2-C-methyl-D-erythritol 4-phosphate cytidylyltransferase
MIAAIIVAAGKGLRMGSTRRKQFLRLGNRPVLSHTLQVFDRSGIIDTTIVVLPETDMDFFFGEVLLRAGMNRAPTAVAGGSRRQESVMNGLAAIDQQDGLVLIHDGVRPLVTVRLIEAVADGARKWGACIPAVPAVDTLKQVDEHGAIVQTRSREFIRLAQTPQAFDLTLIRKAHEMARQRGMTATDDASLVEAVGEKVHTIEGDRRNIKITTPEDLAVAEMYLNFTRPDTTAR